jgi:hypothetical protein
MTFRSITGAGRPATDHSGRTVVLVTAFGLLFMALLAPFAQFGVLQTLIVPADAAATTSNIAGSLGLFRAAIAAFFVVAVLDVVVAWGFYVILRPVHPVLARLVGSLRIGYAMVFGVALVNLVDAARLTGGATADALHSPSLQAQVAASVASFDTGWHLALGIFGLHLVGLGALLFRFAAPRLLAGLVVLAGIGYLADALGRILIADYALTISTFTFVGEALLIVWLFRIAIKGSRSFEPVVGSADRASVAAAS